MYMVFLLNLSNFLYNIYVDFYLVKPAFEISLLRQNVLQIDNVEFRCIL